MTIYSEVSILVLEKPVLSHKMPRRETRVVTGRRIGRQKREGFAASRDAPERWAVPNNSGEQTGHGEHCSTDNTESVICRVWHHKINLSFKDYGDSLKMF